MKQKKRIIAVLLLIALISSCLPTNIVTALNNATLVIGEQGSLPSGGLPNPDGGIVGIDNPTFVVSFTKETFKEENQYAHKGDGTPKVRSKIQRQYNNHVPSVDNSILFAQTPGTYKTDAAIAWYNEGDGGLDGVNKSISKNNMSYKLRLLKTPNENGKEPILDNKLKAGINAKDGDISQLEKKWMGIAKGNYTTENAMELWSYGAMELWSYVLANNGAYMNERLSKFLGSELSVNSTSNIHIQACRWVELMISLWQLSQGKQKDAYADEINRFLNDKDIDKIPNHIAITTAVLVHAPTNKPPYIYVKSYDYVEYIAGITSKYSLYQADKGRRNNNSYLSSGHQAMIKAAILDSLEQKPKMNRVTNTKVSREPFNWGMGGILGYRIYTGPKGSKVMSTSSSSVDNSAIELINFCDKMYGFAIAFPYCYLPPFPCRGNLEIKTNPPKRVLVGTDSPVIGEPVKVYAFIKPKKKENWIDRLDGKFEGDYPKIQINLKRTAPSTRDADKNSTPSVTDTNPEFVSNSGVQANIPQ